MHELTLAERAIALAEAVARNAGARRITRVRLAIGVLAHVDADTLAYCCGMVARDTLAEGAEIQIEPVAGEAWCATCEQQVELSQAGTPCPHCGGFKLEITDGDQMRILDISVEQN
jgi:hydrogenase nickel incorporation protein HypA/HybF